MGEIREFRQGDIPEGTGYLLRGSNDWDNVKDIKYGGVEHLTQLDDEGTPQHDKINTIWNRGVFITTARNHPEKGLQILVIDEERPLIKDEEGNRGHVKITSVPQGIIKEGETWSTAADRLLLKEVGHVAVKQIYLGKVYLDPANSETGHDFCLVLIPADQIAAEPRHDSTEKIENQRWLSLEEIDEMDPPFECAKLLTGIQLSRRHLPGLLQASQEQSIR